MVEREMVLKGIGIFWWETETNKSQWHFWKQSNSTINLWKFQSLCKYVMTYIKLYRQRVKKKSSLETQGWMLPYQAIPWNNSEVQPHFDNEQVACGLWEFVTSAEVLWA